MNDDVLLHDALVVIAPGEEGDPLAAPGAELLKRLREGDAVGEPLLVEAGELFYFVVHALEVYGLGAYLDYLTPQVDWQPVENGGFGAHRLIPLQIHHYIIHRNTVPFSLSADAKHIPSHYITG